MITASDVFLFGVGVGLAVFGVVGVAVLVTAFVRGAVRFSRNEQPDEHEGGGIGA